MPVMQDIMTTQDLIDRLSTLPPDAPVMIAVVKYPEELGIGGKYWLDATYTECHPMHLDEELHIVDGIVHLTVELTDYDEQRHFAGG